MSKPKVARAAPTVQEIPLSDVTSITWEKPHPEWEGEDATVTLTGAQLAPMLKWMIYARHVTMVAPGELLDARLTLTGVADILLALSESDLAGNAIEPQRIFRLLSRVTEDAMAQLAAAEDDAVPRVTITIGRPVPVAATEKKAVA